MGVNSCCCFSLKTGTTIIAVLSILGSIIGIPLSFQETSYKSQEGTIVPLGIVVIVVYFISLALSLMLLIGTLKEKAKFILPCLVWFVIERLISTVLIYVIPTQAITVALAQSGLALIVIVYLIGLGILIYFWLVIYSFYQKLRINEQAGPNVNRV